MEPIWSQLIEQVAYLFLVPLTIYFIVVHGFIRNKGYKIGLISLTGLLVVYGIVKYRAKFNERKWRSHTELSQNNPRWEMVDDLMRKHLRKGQSKNSVVTLLGPPYQTWEDLPPGAQVPDSLSLRTPENSKLENRTRALENYRSYIYQHFNVVKILVYNIGGKVGEEQYLYVKIKDGKVESFDKGL